MNQTRFRRNDNVYAKFGYEWFTNTRLAACKSRVVESNIDAHARQSDSDINTQKTHV